MDLERISECLEFHLQHQNWELLNSRETLNIKLTLDPSFVFDNYSCAEILKIEIEKLYLIRPVVSSENKYA